jgi:hypothetical protein
MMNLKMISNLKCLIQTVIVADPTRPPFRIRKAVWYELSVGRPNMSQMEIGKMV